MKTQSSTKWIGKYKLQKTNDKRLRHFLKLPNSLTSSKKWHLVRLPNLNTLAILFSSSLPSMLESSKKIFSKGYKFTIKSTSKKSKNKTSPSRLDNNNLEYDN